MNPQRWQVWVQGLLAAAITGAATAFLASATSPEIVQQLGYGTLVKVAGSAAVIGVASYLKQSPLPSPEERKQDEQQQP